MSRSSIFSFRTLQPWTRWPAGFITCIVVLVSVEIFVARSDWVVTRYPASTLGAFYAVETEVIRDADPAIICLGNSRLRDALAPRVLERELGMAEGAVLNLSLTTGRPFDARILYRRNRAVLRHAELMILDFEYNYFGNVPELSPRVARFATFRERIRLFRADAQLVPAIIGGVWQTYGLRNYLRALIVNPTPVRDPIIADDGRIVWRDEEADLATIDIEADMVARTRYYDSDRSDARNADELRQLIAMAREDGIRIVVLHVPLAERFVRHLNDVIPLRYRRLRSEFRDAEFDADLVIDWEHGGEIDIPDSDYIDYGHLTLAGSEVMSRATARQLRRLVATDAGTGEQD